MEKINKLTLYKLLTEQGNEDGYEFLEENLTDSDDEEDGGGSYNAIIKRVSDNKFFSVSYTDWDINNTDYDAENDVIGERCDLNPILTEVKPYQSIETKYRVV